MTARPWWLLLALIAGLLATGLVIAGLVSPSTAISGGLFGGMLLMHLGGHGHGGHGRDGGNGPAAPAKGEPNSQATLIGPSGLPPSIGLRARKVRGPADQVNTAKRDVE